MNSNGGNDVCLNGENAGGKPTKETKIVALSAAQLDEEEEARHSGWREFDRPRRVYEREFTGEKVRGEGV